jgi:non-specific serine/threonine protein kinase
MDRNGNAIRQIPTPSPGELHPLAHFPLRLRRPPAPIASMLGRDREIEQLDNLLAAGARLVTISGPGGVGKTRLLLAWLNQTRPAFPHIAWLPLAPLGDAHLFPGALAMSLGVQSGSREAALDELIATIGDRSLLLAVDNVEHLPGVATWLSDLASSCPNLTIVATSRSRLLVAGEQVLRVPPLPSPQPETKPQSLMALPGVQLFIERVRSADPDVTWNDASLELAGRIVHMVEGLPLAIELAAEHAAVLGLSATCEQLGQSLLSLPARGQGLDDRHQTMRRTIDWSFRSLPGSARRAFLRLSVFPASFSLDAAVFVLTGSESDESAARETVLGDLSLLIDHHLLIRHQESPLRFRMLHVLREFGEDQLRADGSYEAALAALTNWCNRAVERHSVIGKGSALRRHQMQVESLTFVENDMPAIRRAFQYLQTISCPPETLLLYPSAVHYYGWVGGDVAEIWQMHEDALDQTPAVASELRARVAIWAGLLGCLLEQEDQAIARAHSSIEYATAIGNPDLLSFCLKTTGQIHGYFDRDAEAVMWLERALRIENVVNPTIELELAAAHLRLQQADLARPYVDRVVAMQRNLGSAHMVIVTNLVAGTLSMADGDMARSNTLFRTAAEEILQNADPALLADVAMSVSVIPVQQRNYERAATLVGAAVALRELTGRKRFRNQPLYWHLKSRLSAGLSPQALKRALTGGSCLGFEATCDLILSTLDTDTSETLSTLTRRETEVLQLLADGLTDSEIANRLFLSRPTVSNHVAAILRKLDVRSRAAAVHVAHDRNMLQ